MIVTLTEQISAKIGSERVKAVSIYILICYRIPKDIAQLNITTDKVPRQDTLFMKKV